MHRMTQAVGVFTVCLISHCLLAQSISQQSGLGAINGVVRDSTGAVVPGVRVTLVNTNTGVQRTATTSNLGFYTMPALPPGLYRITLEKPGFAKLVQDQILLDVQQNLSVDLTLGLGTVTQEVAVVGETPLLEATNTTIGQVINQVETEQLPLNGRQFSQLALLSPGSAPVGGWLQSTAAVNLGSGGISPSINGANGNFNNFTLDGVDNNNKFANFWAVSPPPDAIQEVRVQTSLYAGTSINVAMKSGTNEFHGSAWEFLRNDKLDARNTFDVSKPPYRQNQYGLAGGGPLYIPKLINGRRTGSWIFAYWEGFRSRKSNTYFASVPTPAMLTGDFSSFQGPQMGTDSLNRPVFQRGIYDPFSSRPDPNNPQQLIRDPFPRNVIPRSMLNPVALQYIAHFYPLPNRPALPNNFISQQSAQVNEDQGGVRYDQKIGNSDSLFFRVNIQRGSQISPSPLPIDPVIKQNRTETIVGSYTRIFSPTWVLNGSVGYTRDYTPFYNPGVTPQLQQALGMTPFIPPFPVNGTTIYLADAISIAPNFTSPGQLGWLFGAPDYSYQYNVNISHTKGNHNISAGVIAEKWRHICAPQPQTAVGFSQLTTSQPAFAASTGEPLASMLLGLPSNAIDFIIPQKNSYGTLWDLFIHDQWKVTPRLALNLGLHWNYRQGPYNTATNMSIFNIATGQWQWAATNPFTGAPPNLRADLYNRQYKNFAPAFGIAYQLARKTVLRTGFSIAYDHGITIVQANQELLGNYPFASRPSTFNQNVGVPSGPTISNPLPVSLLPSPNTTPAFTANPWNRTPYVMQWNFGFQQELVGGIVLSTDYVGSRGRELMMQLQYNVGLYPAPGPISARQIFPQFGPFTLDTDEGKSDYDALQAKIERRFSQGLTFLGSYTWSKTLGTASLGVGNSVQDPYHINASRGRLTFDVPHMFVFSSIYELPFGRGKHWLSSGHLSWLLGGWNLGGILSLYAGTPASVTITFDNANTGSSLQYADVVPGQPLTGPKTRQKWFNTAAFKVPTQYTYGNSGVGILRAPGKENLDLTLSKRFPITESKRLEFRLEGFNVFNHTNLNSPSTALGSLSFGVITGAAAPRDIQLGLKFLW